jgi:hypothetical protein
MPFPDNWRLQKSAYGRKVYGAGILAAFTSVFATCATAAPDFAAINELNACTAKITALYHPHRLAVRAGMQGDSTLIHQYEAEIAKINACLDDGLDPAVKAAGADADLRNAVKDFYVKSKAYVKTFDGPADRINELAKNNSWEKTAMEMKLAAAH